MDRWMNIGVTGGACWPPEETKINFGGQTLVLRPATKDTEQSIHINLNEISESDALTLINRFLSILSWCDGQAMENQYGWSGNPVPVSVPRKARFVGSSIAFPFYRQPENNPRASLALALYREGITVNSVPFSFLSFFKILNIFWKDKYVSGQNEIIEGIRACLPIVKYDETKKRINEIGASVL